jgi:hypothetical protein
MTESPIEILLVEDNPSDVALALHAFKQHHLANRVQVLRDGAEALEYFFGTGAYAGRDRPRCPGSCCSTSSCRWSAAWKYWSSSRPIRRPYKTNHNPG